jgi:hypothetical protein
MSSSILICHKGKDENKEIERLKKRQKRKRPSVSQNHQVEDRKQERLEEKQDIQLKLKVPNTVEAHFKDRHPIITGVLTVELGLGLLGFFSYMYVYSYKASYLNFYGIPSMYTEVTISELLNSSWIVINLLQLILAVFFGFLIIAQIQLGKYHSFLKKYPMKVVHPVLFLLHFLLFLFLYWKLYAVSNESFYVPFGINSLDGVSITDVWDDLAINKHFLVTPLFVVLCWLYFQFQKYRQADDVSCEEKIYEKDDHRYSLKILILVGIVISGFFLFLYAYTASSHLGVDIARKKAVYPFITTKDGKVTQEMVVGTYKEQYLVVELFLLPTSPHMGEEHPAKTVKDTYRLIPIDDKVTLTQLKVIGGINQKKKVDFGSIDLEILK